MVPHIAKMGWSFKGAGQYYLHDKQADTDERVGWTYTHNIPTNDPEKAMRWMAYTSSQAQALKQQAGVAPTGRKYKSGPVYSYSLSWHPEQQPDRQTMLDAALETLGLLQLEEHEAVIVNHTDTAHDHVHVVVNLIHPENGKKAVVSYDRLTLSTWAEQVETLEGEIRCPQRVINNELRREQANENKQLALVKHRDKKVERAAHIQKLYTNTSNGHAFQSALQMAGYTLANGHKGRYVIVDAFGQEYALARQLEGQRAKHLKERFKDLKELPEAKVISKQRSKPFDREAYEAARQQKIVDAAIEWEQMKTKGNDSPQSVAQTKPNPSAEHLRKLDALRAWEQRSDQKRNRLKQNLEEQYQRSELLRKIDILKEQTTKRSWLTSRKKAQAELSALKKNLATIDSRIQEQQAALEQQIKKDHPEYKELLTQKEAEYNRRMQEHLKQLNSRDKDHELGL